MHTKDKLADALVAAGLPDMATAARTGYYHDFLSPLALPEITLANELAQVGTAAALALRHRVIQGDFDATTQEGEDWAASPEGQEAFKNLGRTK